MEKLNISLTKNQIELIYNCLPNALLPWEDNDGLIRPSEFTQEEVDELSDLFEDLVFKDGEQNAKET